MIDSVREFWNSIGRRKRYWIPVLFFTISSYGYSVFNRTIGIDDLASEIYTGSGNVMIAAGRWGMTLWRIIDAIPILSPAADRLLAATFLLAAAILLAAMFHHLRPNHQGEPYVCKYTVLSCCLITYPILGEIWEYSGANYISTAGMLISILACTYMLTRETLRARDILLAGVILTLPMSSYESGILFYITLVCSVLFYKYCLWGNPRKKGLYWKNAVMFALPLVTALILRLVIGKGLRLALGVAKGHNGNTGIKWGLDPATDVFRKLIMDTFLNYIVNALVYLPLTVFFFAALFLICYSGCEAIRKRNVMIITGGLILVLSAFSISFVQGSFMPYRTAISLSALTAFALFCLMELWEDKGRRKQTLVSMAMFYLMWAQSAFLNSELALNNMRSDNEMRIMSSVAQKILSVNADKPVIFVGEYQMSDLFRQAKKSYSGSFAGNLYEKVINAVQNQYGDYYYTFCHLTEFPDSNINSGINYSIAVNGIMEKYLSYLGYDIHVIDRSSDPETVREANEIAHNTGMKSFEVLETEDYMIAAIQMP